MDRKIICLALVLVVISASLASCSVAGNTANTGGVQPTFMSYSEKASYYDSLVAGDSDPIPLTTALNGSITIQGDKELLDDEVYDKIVEIANQTYTLIRGKYSTSGATSVTIVLDPSANRSPYYAVGNTLLLNTEWFNNHPNECDMLIEGFASYFMNYERSGLPDWLPEAMKLYVRDEFALYRGESSFNLPKRYNGKSYENDSLSAAAFLKWIKATTSVDIVERLNRQIRSLDGYQVKVWMEATGKTLDRLWSEYKNA